ncbi:hypothetical protein LTR10_003812 [Elasticomyces elasticus]|nr:hypothetical protein LTR10_003812 [Elasticomyces elasticus]KAK4978001.1 hypothetical protein LTR42_002376 [Elasticomyces elasticus]
MSLLTCLTVALAAFQSFAFAEKLTDCSGSCVSKAIGLTGCPSIDSHCICASALFMETVNECVVADCSKDDQEATISVAEGFCAAISSTKQDLKRSIGSRNKREQNPWKPRPPHHSAPKFKPPPKPPGHKPKPPPTKPKPPPSKPTKPPGYPPHPTQTVW